MKTLAEFIAGILENNSDIDRSDAKREAKNLLKAQNEKAYSDFWASNPETECYGKNHTQESLERVLGRRGAMTQILVSL